MSYNRIRTVRLLNGLASDREMALQGLRVLNGSPTQPFARKLTREHVPVSTGESLIAGGSGRITGTVVDLDFRAREWENIQDLQDWQNRHGFNDAGANFG